PVQQPPLPAVKNKDWGHNAVDSFILARLDKEGAAPAPDAPAGMLLRRLSFDLTDLPAPADVSLAPSPTDAKTPQSRTETGPYEAVVDQFLASPAFAERWASHFMDITRFAESSGG